MTKRILSLAVCLAIAALVLGIAIARPPVSRDDKARANDLEKTLKPLHQVLGEPRPGDWLNSHHEPGQTFDQYVRSRPVRPTEKRNILYVQPIGVFNDKQQEILAQTVEFMQLYFGVETKVLKKIPTSAIPDAAQREHPNWGDHQVLTTYVLHDLLAPELPDDALAMIALTSFDLWPGKGWNFVFGQASLRQRVGVWSMYRNGDPEDGDDAYQLCLLRTLKTSTHETGHMLSMQHCIYYECNMCGSNNRGESDRRPVFLCPICTAKLTWATQADAHERAEKLAEWCKAAGLKQEADYYFNCVDVLTKN